MRKQLKVLFLVGICLIVGVAARSLEGRVRRGAGATPKKVAQAQQSSKAFPGQSQTLLPNGWWLLIGGEGSDGVVGGVSIRDPRTGEVRQLSGGLVFPRAWHTATILPDGTVFIFGGVGQKGSLVESAEIYDVDAQQSHLLDTPNLGPRAHHSATLLTEGRLLIAGGTGLDGEVTGTMQIWDPMMKFAHAVDTQMIAPRRGHSASLNADGSVFFSRGSSRNGSAVDFGEVFDPYQQGERIVTNPETLRPQGRSPFVEASLPVNDATDVAINTIIALRLSKPLDVVSVTLDTLQLSGPDGSVSAKVVPAEAGMLAFVTPAAPLQNGADYTLTVSGAKDPSGQPIQDTQIVFTTVGAATTGVVGGASGGDPGDSGPLDDTYHGMPPLKAPAGITALAGQVLRLNAKPLAHVLLQIDDKKTFTDGTGRFLLENLTAGHHAMVIDGTPANHNGVEYGTYEDGVDIKAGETNVLNYKIWMTPLDLQNEVTIPSPTPNEVIVTTPKLPGLELRLPPNTVIRDRNENVVTRISITPIPVNQPPFPLPQGVEVPIYFTIQPGGAYLDMPAGSWAKGARLWYPNWRKAKPGTTFDFWNYDPLQKGWYIYGEGAVSKDSQTIIPNPGVEIYQFTGAMVGSPGAGKNVINQDPNSAGDPVNLSTGQFVYNKTDLVLADVVPLALTRTYTQNDNISRSFGIGAMSNYDIFTVGDTLPWTYQELILPDGSRIHFSRISAGTSYNDAVYMHTATGTSWYGATIVWDTSSFPNAAWALTTKDGTKYFFPDASNQTNPAKMAVLGIRDRHGNTITIARDPYGEVTQITSPNGRYISFQHDTSFRITQAQDNIGRTVVYQYDAVGRLQQVTDAAGGIWIYTYDSNNNMQTIKDARGIVYLTNYYDANNRVYRQVMVDGSTYQFAWTLSSNASQLPYALTGAVAPGGTSASATMTFRGCTTCTAGYSPLVTQVDVTDPNNNVHRVTFGPTGYKTSDIYALGKPEQQTYTYTYYADNLLQSVTDPLGRVTRYSYDANGNVTSITRLSGTPNAVTTTMTYDSAFNQLLSVTDPLNNTTSFTYDSQDNLIGVTDPLQHQTTFVPDSQGKALSATDALGNTAQFSYYQGDLSTITDPLLRTTTRFTDAVGRLVGLTDASGQTTKMAYDALNQITSVTDALGKQTSFGYDPNGNLLSVTDANNHQTQYTYDNMDRVQTRKDALLNQECYGTLSGGVCQANGYDGNGNLIQFTDRRGKVAKFSYDGLNRMSFAGFGWTTGTTYESTVNYTYDGGNRLRTAVDSISGTITRGYDDLDRLNSDATPQGTVSSTYDNAGRRASLTVPGQSVVNYSFDSANRLAQITQGSATVQFSYDADNRRTSVTLPNGIVTSYGYDNASQLTGMTYTNGSTVLGNLTYSYDLNRRRTNTGGSYARTNLPNAISTTAYNANNQLTTWGTANLFYDLNGNMTSDGTHSYAWDARNRLNQIDLGNTASFTYDPFRRRATKNILATTTSFLYDRANAVQEVIGGTNTANSLMGGVDEVFQRTDSVGARSFLSDALGGTLALTDSTGTAQTSYTYEPFGNTSVTGAATTNSFAYTGRELDAGNLYYYRARYYNPSLQRFITEDPIRFNGGINFYGYVQNSPVDFVDPSGKAIGVTKGSGPEGYLAFFTALLYLEQSPYANAIIQQLEQSPQMYYIGVTNAYDHDATLGPDYDLVTWNPELGGCTIRGHRPESPALLLMHELVHVLQNMKGLDQDDEEATQIINQVAAQLGEGTRRNYGDSRYSKDPWPLPIPAGRNCGCK